MTRLSKEMCRCFYNIDIAMLTITVSHIVITIVIISLNKPVQNGRTKQQNSTTRHQTRAGKSRFSGFRFLKTKI